MRASESMNSKASDQMDRDRSVPFMRRELLPCLVLFFAATACGEQTYTLNYAPNFSRTGKHISVFGVKRDGLMNPTGWAALGPEMSAPFDGNSCDVAYTEALSTVLPDLAATVHDSVRANGVTDELLTQLAPAAKGDTIMLITIAGHPSEGSGAGAMQSATAPGSGGGRGGRSGRVGRGGGLQTGGAEPSNANTNPFSVSATFFSVAEHRTVGFVELAYSGARIDEALNEFRAKLELEFPRSTCAGWDWSAHVDEPAIHKLNEQ
jgi:hypothetical protein